MAKTATPIDFGKSWNNQGPSFGLDVMSFIFALVMHIPLFFMKFDAHKKSIDRPSERLVSVDLIEPEKPKPVEVQAPPPPVVKEASLMEKLKALVKKEPPPPPPLDPKPLPEKLLEAPKPLPLQAKLDMPEKIQPTLATKSGFQTKADPKLVNEAKLAMNAPVPGIAPLSAQKLGTIDDRSAVKSNKGSFQLGKGDVVKSIGGDGPSISGAAAPVVSIRTGSKATTENFSAPVTQKTDKGRIGAVPPVGLGGAPQLGLRDSIIARDAGANQINTGSRSGGVPGGVPGGIPGGTGVKKDAGKSFQAVPTPGVSGGTGLGTANSAAPVVASLPKKKEKPSLFVISGPLKDRKIEKQVPPEYPDWAQAQGISASVLLEFTVDPNGFVKNLIVVRKTSGYPKLDDTAIAALRKWKFAPLTDGANREEVGYITFNYSLS
ncbi:MAG: hypothetical protein KCHDKBKB_01965 [Elusimicrobia bacterium]|nr:hypothetical protein [Elusimicrobiota bacterium]